MGEYPVMIISEELAPLYRKFSAQGIIVNVVNNVSDLRAFISKYANVESDIPVVLSDLSRLGMYQSRLLKFVEENKSPLIIISSQDCASRVLLSRFKKIIKYPRIIKNERDRPDFLRDRMVEGEEVPIEDIIRSAPSAYPVMELVSKSDLPSREKIKQVMFSA